MLVEPLEAAIFTIGDVQVTLRSHRYRMHRVELARPGAVFAPLANIDPPATSVLDHTGVAVAVSDKDVPGPRKGNVGRAAELRGLVGNVAHADFQQLLSFGRELVDHRRVSVHRPHLAGGIDADAMRGGEQPLPPRPDQSSVCIKNNDRVALCGSMNDVDCSVLIGGDGRNTLERPWRGHRQVDERDRKLWDCCR